MTETVHIQAGEALETAAPIVSVLVMEDRAQVNRRAEVRLEAGRNLIRVDGVSPLVADRTLRCRLRPAAGAEAGAEGPRVLDAGVRRRYLVRKARPEREQEIRDAVDALAAEYLQAFDRGQVGFGERDLLGATLAGLRQEILDRLVVAPFSADWAEALDRLSERREQGERRLLDLQFEQEDRRVQLERLGTELEQAQRLTSEYTAQIFAEVWAPGGGDFAVEYEYQVPCALWRPAYTAELIETDGPAQIRWRSAGSVWQASGEDWSGVELQFSTARPTLGAELPLLEEDQLRLRQKTDRERKVIEVSSRDQAIAKTGEAQGPALSDTPPGLDDGGEARTYSVPQKVDVPADGRPHRIEFDSWEAAADCELVCMPELAQFVFLRSLQKNPARLPLLAGPVQLLRGGGYVGRSQIHYVAPQERFELSWGSEDGVVVMREVDRDYEETAIRKRKKHDFKIEVYLANHAGADLSLKLYERVPVSEIEQVEVEILEKKTARGFERDDQGLLHWNLDLKAGQEERVELAFRVSTPSNVMWQG